MKERASACVGVDVKQAKVISESDENYFWEHGHLGNGNPEILRNTLVWVFGLNFALRAGQEHCNLRMKKSQLSIGINEDGRQYLEHKEEVRKTNSGRLANTNLKRKTVREYLNFALMAGQEHRTLRMKNSQLSIGIDEDGRQYLEYKEVVRKTNSGRLANTNLKGKP